MVAVSANATLLLNSRPLLDTESAYVNVVASDTGTSHTISDELSTRAGMSMPSKRQHERAANTKLAPVRLTSVDAGPKLGLTADSDGVVSYVKTTWLDSYCS